MGEISFKIERTPLSYIIIEDPLYEKFFNLKKHEANPCIYKTNDERFTKALDFFSPDESEGFYFSSVPVTSDLPVIQRDKGYIRFSTKIHQQAYIDVSTSFDEYFSNFSSKSRSTQKRKMRKFEKISGGEIDWRIYQSPEEIAEFYKLAREISKETYQEASLNLGLPDDQEYYDEVLRKAANGNVRGYLLFLDQKPVSYLFCPITDRGAEFAFLGYLPENSNQSVGAILFLLALENIFDDKDIDTFDFQEGDTVHKSRFATGYIKCANIIYLKDTFKNRLWVYSNHVMNVVVELLISFLEKIGIKTKLKKLIRKFV